MRHLHVPGNPLVLPNVWDAASARIVEAAGFPAVATSSGAVAESLGYTDHQGAPADEMFAATARIARAVNVPVTMDAERGYGLEAAELAARFAECGAQGCNIEDSDATYTGLVPADEQAGRLAALRAASPSLVINARIDVFVRADDQEAVLQDAIERAHVYLGAGADCVYPILIRSADVLKAFVDAVRPAAVNALYLPDGLDLKELAQMGVARVSYGTGLWRITQAAIKEHLPRP